MTGTNWWASVCTGHASERMGFWEGASLEWGKHYDLGRVRLFVVGGDGANRIRSGVGEFGDAVFQLDSFHLSRACSRGYGAELGSAIYEAIRSGQTSFARSLMSAAAECETSTELRHRKYVESNAVSGMDWRNQESTVPADARSLGTMEANGDKTTANRLIQVLHTKSTRREISRIVRRPRPHSEYPETPRSWTRRIRGK